MGVAPHPTRSIAPGPIQRTQASSFLPFFPAETTNMLHTASTNHGFIAEQLPSGCPRAGGLQPPTGCCASGENEKRRRENTFSRPSFFAFSLCPWGLLRLFFPVLSVGQQIPWLVPFPAVFSPFGRKVSARPRYHFAYRVQGGTPCRGVQGTSSPLLRSDIYSPNAYPAAMPSTAEMQMIRMGCFFSFSKRNRPKPAMTSDT